MATLWMFWRLSVVADLMNHDIFSANAPGVTAVLQRASAFIAGAGGLGSNVAAMLARAGIGRLVIADFDTVSYSNLNRQMFTVGQVGLLKVKALRDNLLQINPDLQIEIHPVKLDENNFMMVIPENIDLIFECFDHPEAKASLTRFVLSQYPDVFYIAVSGIGGAGSLDTLKTTSRTPRFYLIGDGESDVRSGQGTLSTRVVTAAAMQADCGIKLLLQKG